MVIRRRFLIVAIFLLVFVSLGLAVSNGTLPKIEKQLRDQNARLFGSHVSELHCADRKELVKFYQPANLAIKPSHWGILGLLASHHYIWVPIQKPKHYSEHLKGYSYIRTFAVFPFVVVVDDGWSHSGASQGSFLHRRQVYVCILFSYVSAGGSNYGAIYTKGTT